MNYISAEEFLKQSEKVQKVLLEWWKPQVGDLYFDDSYEIMDSIKTVNLRTINDLDGHLKYLSTVVIPLLQIHQLIQFIEDRNYLYEIGTHKVFKYIKYSKNNQKYKTENGNDLLQVLWKVAIEIAEEV